MNDVDAAFPDESAKQPCNMWMNVPRNVQRYDSDSVAISFLFQPAPFATGEPDLVSPFLKFACDFKRLDFESAPRMGEAGLKYVQ